MTKIEKEIMQTSFLSVDAKGFYFLYKNLIKIHGKNADEILEWFREECVGREQIRNYLDDIIDFQYQEYGTDKIGIEWLLKEIRIRKV